MATLETLLPVRCINIRHIPVECRRISQNHIMSVRLVDSGYELQCHSVDDSGGFFRENEGISRDKRLFFNC